MPRLARFLTWTGAVGVAASAALHVLSLFGRAQLVGGAVPLLFFGLAVLMPLWAVLWAAHAKRNGVGTWDKQAQNTLAADVFDALPRRRELTLWVALAYGLLWFVLFPIGIAPPGASLAAFFGFFYLLVALVSPLLAEKAAPPFSRRRYNSPLQADRGRQRS